MIIGTLISPIDHLGIVITAQKMKVEVPGNQEFMIINLYNIPISLSFNKEVDKLKILYDPYLYEKDPQQDYDQEEFRKAHPVPDGFIDTLPKWYSVKFTYPEYNLIFVRPGLGISIQTHMLREEHWEVVEGSPIIIFDHNVIYNTPVGKKFAIPFGAMHTVINPNKEKDEWVLIKETYKGHFDEEDIVRVFNPNHYFSKNK
jgi:mannose-6-phosphate isomerase-like protein (cupin superfamily)